MPIYTTISSGAKSATATVVTGGGGLKGVGITTNGAADAVVTIYDNTSAAGTVLYHGIVLSTDLFNYDAFPHAVKFATGLHAVLVGAGAEFIIHYEP